MRCLSLTKQGGSKLVEWGLSTFTSTCEFWRLLLGTQAEAMSTSEETGIIKLLCLQRGESYGLSANVLSASKQ
jgi:hypothetical protein